MPRSAKKKPSPRKKADTAPDRTSGKRRIRRKIGPVRFLGYSLLPALILAVALEFGIRLLNLAAPSMHSNPLPEENYGAMRDDPDLFWSLVPGFRARGDIAELDEVMEININDLGLRYGQVSPKQADEFRILSLGESSTFGAYISNHRTYSARLEAGLNKNAAAGRRYTVINAGVSAYSSFQSLMYLKLRGLKLRPDMVLFYHEYNDYLPSSLRSSSNTEIGLARTDRQLYQSSRGFASRQLITRSALIRFLSYRLAKYRVEKYRKTRKAEAPSNIGLATLGANPQIAAFAEGWDNDFDIKHDALPRRVSPAERRQNLEKLDALCRANGVRLVVIHPSYRRTVRHECILTRFCKDNGVIMYEAHDVLHPDGVSPEEVYIDSAHPTPYGHQLLADGLLPLVKRLSDEAP